MNRRTFLSLCGSTAGCMALSPWSWAADIPQDLKIVRIAGFDLESKRNKYCGKNSRLDVHGDRARDRIVRLYTNTGIESFGHCGARESALEGLLGRSPFDYYKTDEPAFTGPLGRGTMPLWDLAGKVLGKPVYELLGGKGAKRVPVYDGSIYFTDLLPQHTGRWRDQFKDEIDIGFKRGHRVFKIKIGRGAKWMPTEEGFERDKEVLKLIREHAGKDASLAVDANNGYDLARTKRFLTEVPEANLAFIEEMFPEDVEPYLELKAFLAEKNLKALIADGETQNTLEPFKPLVAARAVDVFQGDINTFGIEGILAEAAMARQQDLMVAPHGWGSLLGFFASLHVGRAITNFHSAEDDPLASDLLIADGYVIKDGKVDVPNAPGFGLKLDEEKFASTIKPWCDLKL